MQTRKPISTISFNTEQFLVGKLNELVKAGQLEFYAYIKHQPEPDEITDEAGKKEHFHVYMEPAKQVQTTALREQFKEPDPIVGKPKGCLQIVSSRFDDWYLYALHDTAYLTSKKQSRVWTYEPEQIISSDSDDLQQKVAGIDFSDRNTYLTMYSYQIAGKTFAEYMVSENIAIRDVIPHRKAWDEMTSYEVNRNGRVGHANDYEPSELPKVLKSELPKVKPSALLHDDVQLPGQMTIQDIIKGHS